MTGDSDVIRCDWLQQARIEISSNAIIFHDETFVKMVTVEDIINRLSEERQRCYRAHSDAETRQQQSEDPCIRCVIFPKYPECPDSPCIKKRDWIEQHNHAMIAQAAREELLDVIDLECEEIKSRIESSAMGQSLSEKSRGRIIGILDIRVKIKSLRSATHPSNQIKSPNNSGIPDCCGVNCPDLSQGCKDHCPNGYDHEKATASEQKGDDPK